MSDGMPSYYVLNLWQIRCRRLGLIAAERSPFSLHIATKESSEKTVVAKIKQRFTPQWWEGVLITDVEQVGRLHMIEDKPLYEGSDA